ncbi:MAG: MmcQ/YjbR family DNA-binding protein [Planctomycetes bacterium]|nr:MmcQ/YjbR family DNA-binding protein [Planctomycetota bacterium]
MATRNTLKKAIAALRDCALAYPEVVEDFPWGHCAFKVKGKIFLSTYLDDKDGTLHLSMKLPVSGPMALTLAFASPTKYGLGKHGWVTSRFSAGDAIPLDMLLEWIDESFRAVAPKRIVAQLEV